MGQASISLQKEAAVNAVILDVDHAWTIVADAEYAPCDTEQCEDNRGPEFSCSASDAIKSRLKLTVRMDVPAGDAAAADYIGVAKMLADQISTLGGTNDNCYWPTNGFSAVSASVESVVLIARTSEGVTTQYTRTTLELYTACINIGATDDAFATCSSNAALANVYNFQVDLHRCSSVQDIENCASGSCGNCIPLDKPAEIYLNVKFVESPPDDIISGDTSFTLSADVFYAGSLTQSGPVVAASGGSFSPTDTLRMGIAPDVWSAFEDSSYALTCPAVVLGRFNPVHANCVSTELRAWSMGFECTAKYNNGDLDAYPQELCGAQVIFDADKTINFYSDATTIVYTHTFKRGSDVYAAWNMFATRDFRASQMTTCDAISANVGCSCTSGAKVLPIDVKETKYIVRNASVVPEMGDGKLNPLICKGPAATGYSRETGGFAQGYTEATTCNGAQAVTQRKCEYQELAIESPYNKFISSGFQLDIAGLIPNSFYVLSSLCTLTHCPVTGTATSRRLLSTDSNDSTGSIPAHAHVGFVTGESVDTQNFQLALTLGLVLVVVLVIFGIVAAIMMSRRRDATVVKSAAHLYQPLMSGPVPASASDVESATVPIARTLTPATGLVHRTSTSARFGELKL